MARLSSRLLALLALPLCSNSLAQVAPKLTFSDRPLRVTLFDYPLNVTDGYYLTSMNQSLHVTKGIHQSVSGTQGRLLEEDHPFWGKAITLLGTSVFNVVHAYLPTGLAWQHQEAHRAILRYFGIHSYNMAYEARLFTMRVATNQVSDEDLTNFKAEHPADFNRNRGAGHEAQNDMMLAMKKDAFMYGTPGYRDIPAIFFNTFVIITYVREYKKKDYDEKIDLRNQEEACCVEDRDIQGVEFTPWVYDLFLPDEPYYLRGNNGGVHPYDTAPTVDRYIGNEDLTPEMAKYLDKQAVLVFFTALSPSLFGITRFKSKSPFNGEPFWWNFSFRHDLQGFGHVVDFTAYLMQNQWNLFVTMHNYKNKTNWFPGLDVQVMRYPLGTLFGTALVGMWLQPEDQSFTSTKPKPGGQIQFRLDGPISQKVSWLEWSVETDMKTTGYAAGYVALDPMFEIRAGVNLRY